MSEKQYLYYFSPGRQARFRYFHVLEGGRIVRFSVQYEALIAEEWYPIVRYDTAHGRPHKDRLHPDGSQTKQEFLGLSKEELLLLGERDIKANWRTYRAEFEEARRR